MSEQIDIKKHMELSFESSMLNWYPKIKDLDIPQPRTIILALSKEDILALWSLCEPEGEISTSLRGLIYEAASRIGNYPLFLRSDLGSGKHRWQHTCFVDIKENLFKNLAQLIQWHGEVDMIGMPFRALVFREYIDMDSKFKAFDGIPIAPERRYFIRNGEIEEHCAYWPKGSMIFRPREGYEKLENWEDLLEEMNKETPEEVELLSKYALMVADVIGDDYWSLDFCKSLTGKWILIDMARGEVSWNPKMDEEMAKGKSMFEEVLEDLV